jgi:hypothetical protein
LRPPGIYLGTQNIHAKRGVYAMKRIVVVTVLVVAAAAVAAGTAAPGTDATKNASAACNALKAKMGATAFGQAYSTFGRCVSILAQVEQQNVNSAQAACSSEQNDPTFAVGHSGQTFDQFYGKGPKGKDAFGNCVSAKAKASSKAEQQSRPNPARTCRSLRTQLGATLFAQSYGKNAHDRNAMGKCVSKTAHAQTQNELNAAGACRTEQGDATFAASHGAKTFAQFYGTNDLSNAFGKCVAAKATAAAQSQQQATAAAAKRCQSEQKANPATFKANYGSFGRCVSQHASGH